MLTIDRATIAPGPGTCKVKLGTTGSPRQRSLANTKRMGLKAQGRTVARDSRTGPPSDTRTLSPQRYPASTVGSGWIGAPPGCCDLGPAILPRMAPTSGTEVPRKGASMPATNLNSPTSGSTFLNLIRELRNGLVKSSRRANTISTSGWQNLPQMRRGASDQDRGLGDAGLLRALWPTAPVVGCKPMSAEGRGA